jgi:hypothetical protein
MLVILSIVTLELKMKELDKRINSKAELACFILSVKV